MTETAQVSVTALMIFSGVIGLVAGLAIGAIAALRFAIILGKWAQEHGPD